MTAHTSITSCHDISSIISSGQMQHLIRIFLPNSDPHYHRLIPTLTVHPIPLLFVILHRLLPPSLRLLPLLLRKIRPVKRTRPPQTQPRPHTLHIKQMRRMTRQPHNKRVLVLQEGVVADRTGLVRLERCSRDAIEHCRPRY